MSFEKLQTENEILSREDEKARQLLNKLKRIDAPKDFDFRLKARIANAKSSEFRHPRLFPILRYIAPLSLAIVILGILVFNGLYSFDNQNVPIVVENFSQKPDEKPNLTIDNQLSEDTVPIQSNVQKTIAEDSDKKENSTFSKDPELAANPETPKIEKRAVENEDGSGGSKDFALSNSKVISPKGLNPDRIIDKPKDFDKLTLFSVKDILSQIGIEAIYSDGKWKVESVKQNSLAERSGVKPDDIIQAIDENQISTETIFMKSFSGKNINVIRSGERLEIKLQNK